MIVMPTPKMSASSEKISLMKSEPNALIQETESKMQVLWQIPTINSNGNIKAKFLIGTYVFP